MSLKILEPIIKIDKKIFKIYEEIIANEYSGIFNDEKIKELRQLKELEEWTYKKLNLNYDEIKKIMDELQYMNIEEIEEKINNMIIWDKLRYDDKKIIEYKTKDEYVEQMVLCRIHVYLNKLYYMNSKTSPDINCYTEAGLQIPKIDDETNIYITDDTFLKMRRMDKKDYIKEALHEHEHILTFNAECKKQLEIESEVDIQQMMVMLLDIKSENDSKNRYFYLEELYKIIFYNITLENRILKSDFIFDNLFEQFSVQVSSNEKNRQFLTLHRSQISYMVIFDYIDYLFGFVDSDFNKDNLESKYNLIMFNIYLEKLKAYISIMRSDELEVIKQTCYIYYNKNIENNKCVQLVYSCFRKVNYEKLNKFINMGIEQNKIKQYKKI